MAWLKKDWWKIKRHPRHQNGHGTRVDAKTVLLPRRIRKLAESVDPRRAVAWAFALAAVAVYCVFRWKKMTAQGPTARPEDPGAMETDSVSPVLGLAARFKSFISGPRA